MHLLYTDEVNMDSETTEFFVYAGVAIPEESAQGLSSALDKLRTKHGYRPEDPLKFNTHERPDHISADTHRDIKRDVVAAAVEHSVRLFASFILHEIATSPEEARRNEINRICYHFDCFLASEKSCGLVLIDTFQEKKLTGILREKFAVGLRGLPYTNPYRLQRVLGFHLATIGSSNFSSVIDIVLGSLRYAVNSLGDPSREVVSKQLVAQLSPLCITDPSGKVSELSIFYNPKTIRVTKYLDKYKALHDFLSSTGLEPAQEPSVG